MADDQKPRPYRAHVLLVPFPAQGHMNPIFQFAKHLASYKQLKTTVAVTVFVSKSVHTNPNSNVNIETISDGYDEEGLFGHRRGDAYFERFREVGSKAIAELVKKHESSSEPIKCIVFDSVLPWVVDVAKEHGLFVAAFFTQSATVCSIFYLASQGFLRVPVEEKTVSLPEILPVPEIDRLELPTPLYRSDFSEAVSLRLLISQFSEVGKLDLLLFNTFDELESKVVKTMGLKLPIKAIGPVANGESDRCGLSLFKPSDLAYMKWLNTKETGSVVYIAFGSIIALGQEQMEELISGIKQSHKSFLLVLKQSEHKHLPSNFAEETSGKGLVVTWCSQLEVLAHEAVGCFITHCGWNSTMEALSLGVPMVAMPCVYDQTTIAKFVEDVWGVGIRPRKDEKGVVRRDEFEYCIREVMDHGEKGEVIKKNSSNWKELAKEAIEIGGSSDMNIDEFIANFVPI